MKLLEENIKHHRFVNDKNLRVVGKHCWKILLGLCLLMTTSWAWGSSKPYSILIEGFAPYFTPQQAFVTSGVPIVWENPTATPHTITHDGCREGGACAFDSGAIRPHETFEIPGLSPGQYPYHCTLHPIMRGMVEVGIPLAPSSI